MGPQLLGLVALLFLTLRATADDINLNVGGDQLIAAGFRCDTGAYANGGSKYTASTSTKATGPNKDVFRSHRWVPFGDLEFKIPLPTGSYLLDLMFADTFVTAVDVRAFTVKVNGVLQTNNVTGPSGALDVFKAAGGKDLPYIWSLDSKASAGGFMTITIGRITGKENPMISGIVIKGASADRAIGPDGSCNPDIHKLTQSPSPIGSCGTAKSVTGRVNNGNMFLMNVGGPASPSGFGAENVNYIVESSIGFVAKAPVPVTDNGQWPEPQQDHRYTRGETLTYKIPVPDGTYHVGLLHTESFITAAGQRTFDIIINDEVKFIGFDVFKRNGGKNKPGYTGFGGIAAVNGHISIQLKKRVENPFVNGIQIQGTGAAAVAIGGPESGPCPKKISIPVGCPATNEIETNFVDDHEAHAVSGGPYVETDFKKAGRAKVNLDGTLSHSHARVGDDSGVIQSWEWMWMDKNNTLADAKGMVKMTGPKVTAAFPLGNTSLMLLVKDQYCNPSVHTTTVTVNSATLPGAYCYYYDYGNQNLTSVPLPTSAKENPKPQLGLQVGDINFGNMASFGNFPFKVNTFAVRCMFFLDVKTAAAIQYKIVHSGPVKVFHDGVLVGSSDSMKVNQMTITKKEATKAGLQKWQILYLKPKELEGKLQFQFSNGAVIPASHVRHDSGSTLPVITGLSKRVGPEEQLLKIFGTAFVNGVKVMFGEKPPAILETTAGSIDVRAPVGFPPGSKVAVIVSTEAGESNAFMYTYAQPPNCGPRTLKVVDDFLKHPNGTRFSQKQIAVVKYGPDGRLYCGAVTSMIYALTLDKDFKVTRSCEKNVFEKWERAVLGLAFDPSKNNLKLFFSTSTVSYNRKNKNKIITAPDGWQNGKIKSITMAGPTGCFNNDMADVVTGLPVANHDHAVQAIEFLPGGKMLIGIGGFSNGGITMKDDGLGGYSENPLSGAIVECPADVVTNIKYSSTDPALAQITGGNACKVYAPGFRNTFGMTYATNKYLYATDNGPNIGFGKFATDCNGGAKSAKDTPDKLYKVKPGECHGHPNHNRGKAGNPAQCVHQHQSCVQPILSGLQSSTNGVIEFRSNIFGNEAKGNLFLSRLAYVGNPGRLSRVVLNADGELAKDGFTNIFYPKSGLSIAEGPRGELVMNRHYYNDYVVLKPSYKKPTCTFFTSVMPRKGPLSGGNIVTITGHNFGATPSANFGNKPCRNVKVIDDDTFTCVAPSGLGQVKVVVTGTTGSSLTSGFDYWYH